MCAGLVNRAEHLTHPSLFAADRAVRLAWLNMDKGVTHVACEYFGAPMHSLHIPLLDCRLRRSVCCCSTHR